MKTILIGFKVSIGSMKKDGQTITWNNRDVRFITDAGESEDNVGLSPFEAKFKVEEIAKILGVEPFVKDSSGNLIPNNRDVNDALALCIRREVECTYAPVSGVLKCTGFRLVDPA